MAEYIIHRNVRLGADADIGEYVIIGVPPRGSAPGEIETIIGPRARIRSHSVIYAGNRIGADFQMGHGAMVRELNEIGDDVSVGTHSIIEHHTRIGNGVRLHSNVFVPEYSVLEDHAWIGPGAVLTNARYPMSPGAKADLRGPRVMTGARVGANATILPGVVVGRQALVGAGAVVVRDVPDGKVVVGNPARVINDVTRLPAYRIDELTGQGDQASSSRS